MIAHATSFGFLVVSPVKKQLFLQAGIVTMVMKKIIL